MNLEKKFTSLSKRNQALAQQVKTARAARQVTLAAVQARAKDAVKEAGELKIAIASLSTKLKAGQLKGQFSRFVLAGKMTPAELKTVDFAVLASMTEAQTKFVLSSYDARPVSADVTQFGQRSEPVVASQDMSPAKIREAIALNKGSKGSRSLAADQAEGAEAKKEDEEKKLAGDKEDDKELSGDEKPVKEDKPFTMGADEFKACLDEITGMHAKLQGVIEKLSATQGEADKLASADKEDEKKEEKLEAGAEDDKDLAADDEDEKTEKEKK